jgi:hypothetical protein
MIKILVFIHLIAIFLIQDTILAQYNTVELEKERINIDLEFTFIRTFDMIGSTNENLLVSDLMLGLNSVKLDSGTPNPISKLGRGPGEYESLDDIYVSPITNEMLLLDTNLLRINFFSTESFDFVDSYSIPIPPNAQDGSGFSPYQIWDFMENDSIKYIIGYNQKFNANTQLENREKKFFLLDKNFNILDSNYLTLSADQDPYYAKEPSGDFVVGPRPFGKMSLVDFTTKGEPVMVGLDLPCIRYNKKEKCLDLEPIEISNEVIQLLKSNSYFEPEDLSQMEDVFPYFNEMYITEDEYVWLSRYSNLEYTEVIQYSLSRREIKTVFLVPGFLKLLTVVDNVLYMSSYPYIMDIPQIHKINID